MNNLSGMHGRVVHFRDIHKLIPDRDNYLDKTLQKKVKRCIDAESTLLFMTNSTFDDRPMQDGTYSKSKYKLILFGILESGARATVQINNIEPYFEIKIPDVTKNPEALAQQIYEDLFMCDDDFTKFKNTTNAARVMPEFGFKIEPTRYEVCTGKPLHKFQTHLSNYVKIYFNKLVHRKDAITYVRALGYETAHDDAGSYYRVVCRDYFLQFGTWMSLNNYVIKPSAYLKGDVINIDISDIVPYNEPLTKHLQKDSTMSMAFDIETYNANNDGEIPLPGNAVHNMFMISATFQWYHAASQLLSVVLVDVPSAPHPDFLTVICDNEQNLILGFAQIFEKMQPELVMGFNSDNYDWPWIIERAQTYPGILSQVVECFDATLVKDRNDAKSLYNYKKSVIKIEATLSVDGQNLQTPGYIPFDVMTVFRKLYPVSEQYSLNYFLSKNKLGGKEDMPYLQMFKIYADMRTAVGASSVSEELLQSMALVAKYCVVDSARCHDLTNIRNVLQDKREVANISYTSVYDAFYRADGMKVRNLVISRAQLRHLKISNIAPEGAAEGKYPGAWVFPPIKGLSVSKLSIAERIDKARGGYEPYAEWLNVTPDEILAFKTHIAEHGPGPHNTTMRPCFSDMLDEHMGRPITGLDYSSLYPSLMMAYNLSPEYMITDLARAKSVNKITNADGSKTHELYKIKFDFNNDVVRGWSVRHDNHLDATKPEFKFGIFPTILKELFDARKQLKSGLLGLVHWEHERERLMALPAEEFASSAIKEEFADVCFAYNALDSKQRALKVFMNTFYGESGNKRSPLFMIQVAGGITMAGRDNIKRAYNFVEANGCKTYYGDSVTADTPILIRYTQGPLAGTIDIRTIDNIPDMFVDDEERWEEYPQFKPDEGAPMRIDKQQHMPEQGIETWTTTGWSPLKRVIRHRTNKKIFRINTQNGCVDVTEDHSLLKNDFCSLSPKDAKIGDELFHSFPTEFPNVPKFIPSEQIGNISCRTCGEDKPQYEFYKGITKCKECEWFVRVKNGFTPQMDTYFSEKLYLDNVGKNITIEEAYVFGTFHSDGSCGEYDCPSGIKRSWAISKQDLKHLNKILECLKIAEPNFKFKILDTIKSSSAYKLVPSGRVKTLVEKYRKLFYDKRDYKIVPSCILNASIDIRKSYWEGLYDGDGWKNDKGRINLCQKGKINIQGIYYLMTSIGITDIGVNSQEAKLDIYWLDVLVNKPTNKIKKIFEINIDIKESYISKKLNIVESLENLSIEKEIQYVYDLETEAGTFHCGVGKLLVFNTDSIYLSMPESQFSQIDIDYYTEKITKLVYWEKMVEITFETIKPLNVAVNEHLIADNGTQFLKLAYEEVLFPVAFLAKKKYFGIPHLSKPNFNANVQLFIRGLEMKKRGVSEVLINVCDDILHTAVAVDNTLSIMEIVQSKIVEFYATDWSVPELFAAFIMTGVYKPNKQNVKMHTFKQRMTDERNIDITPGERIKYIIAKKYPYRFDLRGRKIALSIGDKMELADKACEENTPIDIDYYMEKTINGQLARFITYHADFQVAVVDADDAEELKKAELTNLKLARKYVDTYCAKYYTNYASKGDIYKTIFKKSAAVVKDKIVQACGSDKSSAVIIKLLGFSIDPEDNLEEWMLSKIQTEVSKKSKNKNYGETFVAELLTRNTTDKKAYVLQLQDTYYANKNDNISKTSEAHYHERQQILEIRFRQSISMIKNLYHANNSIINAVSTHIKSVINIDNQHNNATDTAPEKELAAYLDANALQRMESECNDIAAANLQSDTMLAGINELKFIYYNLTCNYEYIYQIRCIVECLKAKRNKQINYTKPMDAKTRQNMINTFVNDTVDELMQSNTNY